VQTMKKIILVEDDTGILDAVTLAFSSPQCRVVVYQDANKLLKGVFEVPELFIIDKQLPGVDGLDLCKQLRKNDRTCHIPIIVISASPHIQKLVVKAGANEFVEKPF